jgi:hypothetical protein
MSWVQTMVRETILDGKDGINVGCFGEMPHKGKIENVDHSFLGIDIENMHRDQFAS